MAWGRGYSSGTNSTDTYVATRLIRLARIVQVRPTQEAHMAKNTGKQWERRWKQTLRRTAIKGIFELKKGGYLIRAQPTDPRTGRKRDIRRVLPSATLREAVLALEVEKERAQAGGHRERTMRFADYAVLLLERKIAVGDLTTTPSMDKWKHTLEHLILGVESKDGRVRTTGFGEFRVDQISTADVDLWKAGVCKLIEKGEYSPHTANSWLGVLKSVDRAISRDFQLGRMFTFGTTCFDTAQHETYTEEEPNALRPEWVGPFLAALRQMHPQHYAMAYLGFITGLRPSSLRPLRRNGPDADVVWDEGRLLIRRSQTRGERVRKVTKQRTRYSIHLPETAMKILRWHVDTQLRRPEQADSALLFPSILGGYRAPTLLNKPFAQVAREIGLPFTFTQKGMRRTFQDLTRAAEVHDVVIRSISGHLTEEMQRHYSTASGVEQSQSIAKVIRLFSAREHAKHGEEGKEDYREDPELHKEDSDPNLGGPRLLSLGSG